MLGLVAAAALYYTPPPISYECIPAPSPASNALVQYICEVNDRKVGLLGQFMKADGTRASDYVRAEITEQALEACIMVHTVHMAAVDATPADILRAAKTHCNLEEYQYEMYLSAIAPKPAGQEFYRSAYYTAVRNDLDAAIISLRSGLTPAWLPRLSGHHE
jgi:hypothetical protein